MMMHEMKNIEKLFMVHQPVCPVKISVMDKKHQGKHCEKIDPAIIADVFIIERMW